MIFSRLTARLPLICRVALFGTAVACLAWCAHVVTRRLVELSDPAAGLLLGLPAFVAIFASYAALRFDDIPVRRVAREMVFIGLSLLAVETSIGMWAPDLGSAKLTREKVAARFELPFDARTKSQVVATLQSQGADAFPGISREWPRMSGVRQQFPENFFPLSHASKAQIFECNEGGEYVSYASDEYGLNNPPGLVASKHVDIAVLGSSFALGHCVAPAKSFVGLLRSQFPRTANFAMAGSRVLTSLAAFREYIEPLKPPTVIWVVNALAVDAPEESSDPILKQYLQPTFTQNLATRQELVDRTWREFAVAVQFEVDRKDKVTERRADADRLDGIPYLYNLRRKLGVEQLPIERARAPDLASMMASLDLMKRAVEHWGGELIVMIEPLHAEVVANQLDGSLRHDRLAAAIEQAGVPVIDAVEPLLQFPDRQGLFTLRIGNHLNERGNAMVAEFTLAQLKGRFGLAAPRSPSPSADAREDVGAE